MRGYEIESKDGRITKDQRGGEMEQGNWGGYKSPAGQNGWCRNCRSTAGGDLDVRLDMQVACE